MEKQPQNLKPVLLILGIIVVLGGGGFAIWSVTKKEEKPEIQPQESTDKPPVGGRRDVTDQYTEEELQHSALVNNDLPDLSPEYEAVLISSSAGKKLIEDRIEKIQLNIVDSDKIRAMHHVGRTLVGNSAFSSKANQKIDAMFGLLDGTTAGNYKTYPVYGKYETEAPALRQDLENFLSKDGQGYNLTALRHGGNSWWLGSVGLNLMYGNQNSHLHSNDDIWWWKADRDGLNFYKDINGHDVPDRRLADDKKNGQGVFAAWGAYTLAQEWLKQMDFFDKVTRQEAITALEREGLVKRI